MLDHVADADHADNSVPSVTSTWRVRRLVMIAITRGSPSCVEQIATLRFMMLATRIMGASVPYSATALQPLRQRPQVFPGRTGDSTIVGPGVTEMTSGALVLKISPTNI
jgi:hypothetical protein